MTIAAGEQCGFYKSREQHRAFDTFDKSAETHPCERRLDGWWMLEAGGKRDDARGRARFRRIGSGLPGRIRFQPEIVIASHLFDVVRDMGFLHFDPVLKAEKAV